MGYEGSFRADDQQSDDRFTQKFGGSCPSDVHSCTVDSLASDERSPRRQRPGPLPQKDGTLSEEDGLHIGGDSSSRSSEDTARKTAAFFEQSNQHILDLEQKLLVTNQRFEEAKKRLAFEENRALKAEEELEKTRNNYEGTQLEHQLERNLLHAQEKYKRLDATSKDECLKSREIEDRFNREKDQCDDLQKIFESAKKEKEELVAKLNELQEGKVALESQEEINKKAIKERRHNLKMMAAQRDETLELLDKAMRQKEQTKQGRQRAVEEKQRQVIVLQEERAKEQHDIRQLLYNVDNLVTNLQSGLQKAHKEKEKARNRPETFQEIIRRPETYQELLRVRDGMHMLIKKRTTFDAPAHTESGRSVDIPPA